MHQFAVLFRCLSMALLRNGLKAMAQSVPLEPALYEIAESTLEEYRRRCNDADAEARLRAELEALAQARGEDVRRAAEDAIREAAANQPAQVREAMTAYLRQVPQVVRILAENLLAHLELPTPPPPPPAVLLYEQRRTVSPPSSVVAEPSFTNSFGMKMVSIPRGTFWVGGSAGKPGDRQVTIPHDFHLGTTEVTQGQWVAVTGGANPSQFSRNGLYKNLVKDVSDDDLAQFPVENVSWDMIQKEFLPKSNAREANGEWKYRLPTEAEWEYSCRGGATSKQDCSFDFYLDRGPTNDLSSADANFDGRQPAGKAEQGLYLNRPCRVGSYKPNRLGLYDMHGNVWEWCDDPSESGLSRILRGGCWNFDGSNCAAGYRGWFVPSYRARYLGFRVARVPVR